MHKMVRRLETEHHDGGASPCKKKGLLRPQSDRKESEKGQTRSVGINARTIAGESAKKRAARKMWTKTHTWKAAKHEGVSRRAAGKEGAKKPK